MKKFRKLMAVTLAVLTVSAASGAALAADVGFGSAAVEQNRTYTLPEMLTYAIQDEYLALAEYEAITGAYGAQRPFANILRAEQVHISRLEPLFEEYGVALPENTVEEYTTLPGTLQDAYQAGVDAELSNIAMYEAFLGQDLPDDVEAVFTALKNASQHHLTAFERGLSRPADGTAAGAGTLVRQRRGRTG